MAKRWNVKHLALASFTLLVACGCETREDGAAELGAQARVRAAATCAAGDAHDTCVEAACKSACGGVEYDGPQRRCFESCLGEGVCNSDADCPSPRKCVAVAPVVRRCTAE